MCVKKSELSIEERGKIIALYQDSVQKNSMRKIAALTGYPLSTVFDTIDRFRKTKSLKNLPRSGRPSAITESDRRYLKLCALRNRQKTLAILTEDFNVGRKIPVSKSVINRSLHSWGMIGRVAVRKPLLSARNVKKRLRFAKEHVKWTKEKWSKVLFTDESKFDLFGNNRRVYVRRMLGERFLNNCLTPTVKHGGGNIMVWGGICVKGVTLLKRIEGIMDKNVYHSILVHRAVPEGKKLLGKGFVFQEDNDPKHSSNLCRNYLASKEKSGRQKKMF
jgi:transposase